MPPYGAPPGWYPPPGQGFPPGPFSPPQPGQMPPPIGPPGQQQQPQPQGPQQQQPPPPIGPSGAKDLAAKPPQKVEADSTAAKPDAAKPSSKAGTPVPSGPAAGAKQPPPPPVESKPDVSAALAPATTTTGSATSTAAQTTSPQPSAATGKAPPTGPKNNRIVPAIPLGSNNQQPRQAPVAPLQSASANVPPKMTAASASQPVAAQAAALNYQNATQAATAAVAAAMAKLPPAPGQKAGAAEGSAMDNLTKKVAEMRADDRIRHGNKPGTGGFAHPRGGAQHRGRGAARGGMNKVEVPTTDYDFESANAKFNKQDLVKEAIATGSPLGDSAAAPNGSPAGGEASPTNGTDGEKTAGTHPDVVIPTDKPATYNKATSFFDNISSEMRDREEATSRRGAEFRSEERRKNMETFGQGSVDGYRQGYRGRGRGRGGGYRGGRGYGGRGRGGPTRGRGGMQQAGAANGGA
ncbi:FDF domain-containing protein [Lineolata rhizophorae]|uniref:FDF domain-containing protein n=1 Tax=Lineolata rhizophorae TaxID=578093 RepID=A0A6A6PGH9_9PEZI|nr:FDF domain-containing protein [Lineolata rhizophorae]